MMAASCYILQLLAVLGESERVRERVSVIKVIEEHEKEQK
jgi:hypothetical protein